MLLKVLSTQRRESNPRPFGPKPNTPTTTPHLDLLLDFGKNMFFEFDLNLGLKTSDATAHLVDFGIIFGQKCPDP